MDEHRATMSNTFLFEFYHDVWPLLHIFYKKDGEVKWPEFQIFKLKML